MRGRSSGAMGTGHAFPSFVRGASQERETMMAPAERSTSSLRGPKISPSRRPA
jgi:hypothetical protein